MTITSLPSIRRCPDSRPCRHCAAGCPEPPTGYTPDSPSLWEMDENDRLTLPPQYHRPEWVGTCNPPGWFCAACWGDGWVTS